MTENGEGLSRAVPNSHAHKKQLFHLLLFTGIPAKSVGTLPLLSSIIAPWRTDSA